MLSGILTACGQQWLTKDEELSAQLEQLWEQGGSVLFRDLTGGDWDRVYISYEPVTREFVEEQVGARVAMEDTFMQRGNVLVFLKNNTVQRATFVTPNLLRDGMYGSTLRLEAPGYPALIRMMPS